MLILDKNCINRNLFIDNREEVGDWSCDVIVVKNCIKELSFRIVWGYFESILSGDFICCIFGWFINF